MTYPAGGYAPDRSAIQRSAITLIVVGFLCGGTIPAVMGIIALVQMDSDPASARTMNKVGWIFFWVIFGLLLLFLLVYFGIFVLIMGAAFIPLLGT